MEGEVPLRWDREMSVIFIISFYSYENCIFLDVKVQKALGYKITSLLSHNAYTRKNIGYLYAIEHGAKIIYETDDDNSPTNGNIEFDQDLQNEDLVYKTPTNSVVVNPYVHFGQSSIWPRGYPLDMIAKQPVHTFKRCNNQSAFIQQGIVNGDPDVDAIYRLTRKDEGVRLDVEFDNNAEPVLIPNGLLAPYNSQNTLHLYNAFWGLLLPQTVAFRVCDIWRGYWAQRLLWEIDGYLSFFGPNANQVRNSHSYLEDFIDEKDLYHKGSDLVNFLVNWKPRSKEDLFFDKVIQLSQEMAVKTFWKSEDVILVKYWLEDLISIGYKPPRSSSAELRNAFCNGKEETIKPVEQPSSYLRLGKKLKTIFS